MPKLMLVEDDNNLREIYEARLQAEGYIIVSARDGEEALVIAKAEKPDLIISDVMMPKISGFEMLDILRNTDELQGIKIIMLTALGQADDQQRADRLGADRYLIKSQVTLEDIVKVTHELLEDQTEAADIPAIAPAAPAVAAPVPAMTPQAADPSPTPAPPAVEPTVATAPAEPVAITAPIQPTITTAPAPVAVALPPSEPVEPATTIPAAPLLEPADAAIPTAPPASVAADDNVQSTAQEEGAVEAQIETFVAGATQEPSTPADVVPTNSDTLVEAPIDEPTPVIEEPITPEPLAPVPAQPESETQIIRPEARVESADVAEAQVKELTDPPSNAATGSVPIAHKKVISPLQDDTKKDISTLVALEEAKQAASQGPPPPTATISTNETGAETAPLIPPPVAPSATPFSSETKVDPNSIAL